MFKQISTILLIFLPFCLIEAFGPPPELIKKERESQNKTVEVEQKKSSSNENPQLGKKENIQTNYNKKNSIEPKIKEFADNSQKSIHNKKNHEKMIDADKGNKFGESKKKRLNKYKKKNTKISLEKKRLPGNEKVEKNGEAAKIKKAQHQDIDDEYLKKKADVLYKKANKEILDEYKIRDYLRAVKIYPAHVKSLFKIAWHLQKMNLRQKSEKYYKLCLKYSPKHFAALNNLGNIYKDWRMFPKALEYYRKAMEVNPHYVTAPFNIGNLYKGRKQYHLALEAYKKALLADPDYFSALVNIALVYKHLAKGDSREENEKNAINYFEQALSKRPKAVSIYYYLGFLYKKRNETDKAIYNLEKVLQYARYTDKKYKKAKELLGTLKHEGS